MKALFAAILRLYPAEYRAAFGAELLNVFDEARTEARRQGIWSSLGFTCRELSGVLKDLFVQWFAKLSSPQQYLSPDESDANDIAGPEMEVVRAQRRLRFLIRSMEFAIAHHDFPNARLYSFQERTERARLEQLLNGN